MAKKGFHPTKEALIKTVLELLETQSIDEINSDEVLDKSGISKGSMYHHFQDFNDLLEHAQVARFASYVDNSIEMISKLLVLKTKEEFVQGLKDVTRYTQSDLLKSQRLYRATAISRAGVSERMRVHLGEEQSRLTASLGDLYHEVLNRGWGNPNLKPQTLAVFIQAYTLGIIVNDYVDDQMDLENWFWLVDHFMSDIALKTD